MMSGEADYNGAGRPLTGRAKHAVERQRDEACELISEVTLRVKP
jgi:hypothetical protein